MRLLENKYLNKKPRIRKWSEGKSLKYENKIIICKSCGWGNHNHICCRCLAVIDNN